MRNEEECVCSVCLFRCNIFIGFRIIKEMPGLVGSGAPYSSNLESWEPSQHSLIDIGKPRKTCAEVAGRRTFWILTSSQQSGN